MPAKSIKQQRFMGMVRRAQKTGQASSPEVAEVAASMKKNDVKKFASTKHKGLPMKKEEFIKEEEADRLRDRRMERGGVDGNTRYPSKPSGGGAKRKSPEEIRAAQKKALDIVKGQITAKYGKGAIKEEELTEKKKGLWANIHAKRKRGEKPAKPGDKDYPKTLNVEGLAPGDIDQKVGAVTAIPKKEQEAAKERLLKKAAAKRAALKTEAVANKAEYEKVAKERAPKDDKKLAYQFKDNKDRRRDLKKLARLVKHADGMKRNPAMYDSYQPKFAGNYEGPLYAPHPDLIKERGDFWHPDPEKDKKLGGPGANQRAREDRGAKSSSSSSSSDSKKLKKGESYMDYSKRQKASKKPRYSPELQKRIDAAKARKKEGIVGKVMRKVGLKKEGVITFREFIAEGNRTGRMMQKSKTQVTGHISADRGSDEKKNREGRKTLEKDLKKHGIGHKKGLGEYKYGSGETGREVSYQTSKPDKMSKRRFGKVMRRLGRKHGQESVITKDKDKSAKLHYTEKGSKAKSDSIGKTKAGKHPEGYGETSGTKVRGGKLPKKTTKGAYHYG